MRVLMTTTSSSLMDGINRHILTVSKGLHERGVEVAVCITQPGGELASALEAVGVRAYSLNARNGHDFRIFWRLGRIMKEFRPDICHVHVLPLMGKILFSTKYRKLKYIITVHGIGDTIKQTTLRMRFRAFLGKLFSLEFYEYCCISEGVKRFLAKNFGGNRGVVIYNPIQFDVRRCKSGALRDMLQLKVPVMFIGTACRFAEQKNPIAFMEVFCRVLSKNGNVHAVLIGDGEESLKIAMRAVQDRYGCGDRIHWLGYRSDAPELVGDLDCFVMTSHWEGLPTSLLEAMSASVPVAFWKGGGGLIDLAQMNEDEGNFAVVAEQGDVQGLVDGIVRVLHGGKDVETMRDMEIKICRRHFNLDRIAERLHGVYERAIEGQ